MKDKEAIKKVKDIIMAEIKRLPSHYDTEVNDYVYDSISEVDELLQLNKLICVALEKQIPKKPIYSDYGYNDFDELLPNCAKCPSCGREIPYGTWNYEDSHHCECGQALDWDEENQYEAYQDEMGGIAEMVTIESEV